MRVQSPLRAVEADHVRPICAKVIPARGTATKADPSTTRIPDRTPMPIPNPSRPACRPAHPVHRRHPSPAPCRDSASKWKAAAPPGSDSPQAPPPAPRAQPPASEASPATGRGRPDPDISPPCGIGQVEMDAMRVEGQGRKAEQAAPRPPSHPRASPQRAPEPAGAGETVGHGDEDDVLFLLDRQPFVPMHLMATVTKTMRPVFPVFSETCVISERRRISAPIRSGAWNRSRPPSHIRRSSGTGGRNPPRADARPAPVPPSVLRASNPSSAKARAAP